jgi:hypothetical protein
MAVEYSGYEGVGGKPGKEFIKVDKTTVPIDMTAFAYQTGVVTVDYSWQKTVSACCLGTAKCDGKPFNRNIPKDAIVKIGDIPAGVTDLYIALETKIAGDALLKPDVDIQLRNARTGELLIGYCDDCPGLDQNNLPIGNIDGPEERVFGNALFKYSGFEPVPNPGDEFIELVGAYEDPLELSAFGYSEGVATVTYSYRNAVPAS